RTKDHHRTAYNPRQREILENEFWKNKFLNAIRREKIAAETDLDAKQVCYWFQNRRVKEKKL
ncbi:hypothetical protein HELRODRAFT_92635, partial [Helobdella robusta]|uniref:Homeobox domain-containing protein n=1 Tax=Helobdella robusta TaxID=6412 RepID=T1G8J2_HELRO